MRWPTRPVLVWKGTAGLRIVSPSLSAGGPKTRSLLSAADNAWRLDRPNRPQTDHRNLNLEKTIKNGTSLEYTHITERCANRNDLQIHSSKTTKSHAFLKCSGSYPVPTGSCRCLDRSQCLNLQGQVDTV